MMRLITAILLLTVLSATPVLAAGFGGVENWYLAPTVQYFDWREFRENGQRLLKEEGALFGVGAVVRINMLNTASGSLMFKGHGQLFGGEVSYDGMTQNDPQNPSQSERPAKTDVVYFGTKLEGDGGWRITSGKASVEPFAGLGWRWWLRDLQNSTARDSSGNSFDVSGYSEYWQSLYLRLGARLGYKLDNGVQFFAEGGGRYPLYNENSVDFPGSGRVSIKPGREWSAFAETGLSFKRFRPALYYEGFRFSQSSQVQVSDNLSISQPRSESDIFGFTFGVSF